MKQRKLALSLLVAATLFSTASFATYKDELLPAHANVPFNWSGYYVGLNAGALQHTMNVTDTNAASFMSTIQQSTNPTVTGGIQIGYRHQVDYTNTSGVYGIELSDDVVNSTYNKQYGSPFATYQINATNAVKNVMLLELTGGIAAERTLVFLSAGLSWSNINGSMTNVSSAPFFTSVNFSKKPFGTTLGGGVEYAYNKALSIRFKVDVVSPNSYTATDDVGNTYQVSNNIVLGTIGVNYNFG